MAQKHDISCIEKPMTVATTEQGPQKRYRRLRFPSFNSDVWSEKNPLLQKGELGHEKDTGRFKVGDGVTYWEDLPYNSVGDKGDKGDNATVNGYNIINIVEGRNISVEQEGDTLIISAKGEASGSYNKEEIDNKFAVVNSSIDANADAIQKTRNDYIEADSEIHQILNSHAGELTTLKNNQDELGDQVSGIEEKIPETASGTNHLITKQQLSDAEMDIREEISAVDSSAVHKTGNETITGLKTFSGTILTGAGTGIAIAGTDYSYTMRSAGATPNGCGLFLNNDASHPAFLATDTKITVGGGNIVPYAVTPPSSDSSTRIATTKWVNDAAVHKTGDETITGIKSLNGLRLRNDVPVSKDITANTETTLAQTTLNTAGGIDGASIIRYVHANGNREVRYRAGFSKRNSSGNVWPGIRVGVDINDKVYYKIDEDPAASSNGTDIATTAWSNAKFLQLAGGTLSGDITRSGTLLAKRNVDNSYLELDGGTTYLKGAYLRLDGKDGTNNGSFTLATGNGSTNKQLIGKTDGSLFWDGVYVVTTKAKSLAQNGYVKFNNGLIIQWGRIAAEASSTAGSVTFPTAFTSANAAVQIESMAAGNSYFLRITSITTTGFSYNVDKPGSSSANPTAEKTWMAIGY